MPRSGKDHLPSSVLSVGQAASNVLFLCLRLDFWGSKSTRVLLWLVRGNSQQNPRLGEAHLLSWAMLHFSDNLTLPVTLEDKRSAWSSAGIEIKWRLKADPCLRVSKFDPIWVERCK